VSNSGVIELFTIICLESMYRTTKLGGHVCVKGGKGGGDVGLLAKGKCPNKVRIVIKNNKIIKKTRITSNRGGPYITII
jgi:hypothetical protein